jgi:hypothetical protein
VEGAGWKPGEEVRLEEASGVEIRTVADRNAEIQAALQYG